MKNTLASFMVAVVLVGTLIPALTIQPVKAAGPIYIRADGRIDPSTASLVSADNVTYVFTDNLGDSIVVERDNIVVDGTGHTLEGAGTATGIDLTGRTSVRIRNVRIMNFSYGVWVHSSFNSSVSNVNVTSNSYYGIALVGSSGNNISGNQVTGNFHGVGLEASRNNSLSGNVLAGNAYGMWLYSYSSYNVVRGNAFTNDGLVVSDSYLNVVEDNTVNGKPLIYLENAADRDVTDAGQVILVNSTDVRVEHLNLSRTTIGVQLWQTRNSSITGNTLESSRHGAWLYASSHNNLTGNTAASNAYGVRLTRSRDNQVTGNTVTHNVLGILLEYYSTYNTLSGNTVTANTGYGILLDAASSNRVSDNHVAGSYYGVQLGHSSDYNQVSRNHVTANAGGGIDLVYFSNYNSITENTITANERGLGISACDHSRVSGNHITHNFCGVRLEQAFNTRFYHNNVVDNSQQVNLIALGDANVWDDGYPAGGNYWNDYTDTDAFKGAQQNNAGSDGVWDHPYVMAIHVEDQYPLTRPFGGPDGDVDGDRDVDIFDIVAMAEGYGVTCPAPAYDRRCDADLDGDVDLFDVVAAAANYGESW